VEPEQDAGHLGEQVGTSGREFLELGHRSIRLLLCRLIPAGVVPDDAVQPGYEQPIRLRAQMILNHLAMIEHVCDKSKLAKPSGQRGELVTGLFPQRPIGS
jgi:hypothetical protein